MKKIGKNTKLYLIGMIIGGITLGITTVIADTIINSASVAYKTTTVKAALDELYDIADFKQEVKDMLYPVGSIYISVSDTNPSQFFGGTWARFGMGRTLIGVGTVEANNNNNFGSLAAGSNTFSLAENKGGVYARTLSINEIPPHTHKIYTSYSGTGYDGILGKPLSNPGVIGGGTPPVASTESSGGGQAFNIVPPFITVYMWKRTA